MAVSLKGAIFAVQKSNKQQQVNKMKTNDYAKFCLKQGDRIRVEISNPFGFGVKQKNILKEKGCFFMNNEDAVWYFEAGNLEEYKEKCKSLKGFEMENFQIVR